MNKLVIVAVLCAHAFIIVASGVATVKSASTKTDSSSGSDNPFKSFFDDLRDVTKGQGLTASVEDTTVNGIEGFNLNWVVPFKVQDYIVGFKYNIGELKKLPETLFAKKTWETDESTLTVETDFSVNSKVAGVDAKLKIKKLGVTLSTAADTEDRFTEFGLSTAHKLESGAKIAFNSAFDNLKSKLKVSAKISNDEVGAKIAYDTKAQDPVLTLTKSLDSNHGISPSISLKTGATSFQFNRKYSGGELVADYTPGENVVLEWTDEGSNGEWVTKATIPVDNQAATKVSFARKWTY